MSSSLARALAGALLIAAAGLLGGCGDHRVRLGVSPGAAHVNGAYMGGQKQIKLFVETVHLDPAREGRRGKTSLITVNLAVLSERAGDARFHLASSRLDVDGNASSPVESHVVSLAPGKITRTTLTFRVPVTPEEFETATLNLVIGEEGDPAKFAVPLGAVGD